MSKLTSTQHDDILVLTIENPPVNAFSPGVPEGIKAGLDHAANDDSIQAVVLIGGGRTFVAGADIKTFNLPRSEAPDLRGTVAKLDGFNKPVVAALHGTALGGGFELALACHYRVAVPNAKMGLPEVKLGVLPGAGGTQRLPRVVGAEKALEMILSGNPIQAPQAKELGLIDQIIEGELLAGALAFANKIATQRPLPRISEHTIEDTSPEVFEAARQRIAKTHRGQLSPKLIVDLVEIAAQKPFAQGWEADAKKFMEARESPQSRGMRHLFFAERQAAKVPGITKETPRLSIQSVGMIGAGTMGGGISMNFLNAGLPVTLVDTSSEALERGVAQIRKNYDATVRKGRMTAKQAEQCMALLNTSLQLEDLSQTDLIIEAVFENMEVKKEIFSKLDHICKPQAILATNTSTLDINEIAAVTSRPENVIGLHFFSPANIMKLLEIVRAKHTSLSVLATCLDLAKAIKKVGVVVGVCNGFLGNRMLYKYREEASHLVRQGNKPEEIDAAIRTFGFPMGPFEMSDLAGLDIGYFARWEQAKAEGKPKPDDWLDRIVEMGRKGQKTGKGVYDYPEGRKPIPSPETEQLLTQFRTEKGIQTQVSMPEDITKRLIYLLANEGAHILEEGIAQRSSDIDTAYVYGYGFPKYHGGPMHYASEQGLQNVLADLESFGVTPAPLLKELAKEGKSFADWEANKA